MKQIFENVTGCGLFDNFVCYDTYCIQVHLLHRRSLVWSCTSGFEEGKKSSTHTTNLLVCHKSGKSHRLCLKWERKNIWRSKRLERGAYMKSLRHKPPYPHTNFSLILCCSGKFRQNKGLTLTLKQWTKGNLVSLICEAKSMSKQDVLMMVTGPSNIVQWIETMLSKLTTFPYIHWVAQRNPGSTPGRGNEAVTLFWHRREVQHILISLVNGLFSRACLNKRLEGSIIKANSDTQLAFRR